MTVLYCADTRFPIERANGVQTMATAHALAGRGHDVVLVVRPDTHVPARDAFAFYAVAPEPRLVIRPLAVSGGAATRRASFLLGAARLALQQPGVVYTRDLGLASFLLQVPGRRRPRVIYESHGVADVVSAEMPALLGRPDLAPSAAKLRRLARREARVWRHAAGYVTITHALANELTTRFGARAHVYVVPDGASAVEATVTDAPGEPGVVGYAGHLYPWKGVDTLIRALAQAPDLRAIIIGGHPSEGDRARVEALARELGVAARVTFTGLVAPPDVLRHLARASVLVLPNTASAISERYTSPLKLFEYLAIGRPIVASDLPSIREIVQDGRSAVLVPPGDPSAMAAALRRVTSDAALASALAREAQQLAPQFSWQARGARLDAALTAVCA